MIIRMPSRSITTVRRRAFNDEFINEVLLGVRALFGAQHKY